MKRASTQAEIAALAQQLARALAQQAEPANDTPTIDEEALREMARRDADRMRRARNRRG